MTDISKEKPEAFNGNLSIVNLIEKNEIIFQLSIVASEPDMQGVYSCVLKDQRGFYSESRKAHVRMEGKD